MDKLAIGAAVVVLVAVILALMGLVFLGAWNIGVVGLVGAAGGNVATIDFLTAVFGSLAVAATGNLLHGTKVEKKG